MIDKNKKDQIKLEGRKLKSPEGERKRDDQCSPFSL